LFQREPSVHENVTDTRAELVRFVIGCMILDGLGVEDHDIGKLAGPQVAAIFQR
jgi:hypothetical protein